MFELNSSYMDNNVEYIYCLLVKKTVKILKKSRKLNLKKVVCKVLIKNLEKVMI